MTSLDEIIATKEWVAQYVKEQLSGVVIPPDPDPAPLKCKEGPTIKWISIISKNRIEIGFHGVNITDADITVTNEAGRLIGSLKGSPGSNHPGITLNEVLKDETYSVKFKATNCTGFDSRLFNGLTGQLPEEKNIGEVISVNLEQ